MGRSAPVLLVDDTPVNLSALASALRPESDAILTAEDGEAAWAILDADPAFDVVLLDVMMPRLDGMGLLKRMKEDPPSNVPVISRPPIRRRKAHRRASAPGPSTTSPSP